MQAPAVRIRRSCDTRTKFDYNRSHITTIACTAAAVTPTAAANRPSDGMAGPRQRPAAPMSARVRA